MNCCAGTVKFRHDAGFDARGNEFLYACGITAYLLIMVVLRTKE